MAFKRIQSQLVQMIWTEQNLLANSALVWPRGTTVTPRMRKVNSTRPARPLSIDQRAEDGGASSLSNAIDRRITRLDAIAQVRPAVSVNLLAIIWIFKPSDDELNTGVTKRRS